MEVRKTGNASENVSWTFQKMPRGTRRRIVWGMSCRMPQGMLRVKSREHFRQWFEKSLRDCFGEYLGKHLENALKNIQKKLSLRYSLKYSPFIVPCSTIHCSGFSGFLFTLFIYCPSHIHKLYKAWKTTVLFY